MRFSLRPRRAGSFATLCEQLEERRLLATFAITPGQAKSGSIAPTGVDKYTFSATVGEVYQVLLAETSKAPFFPFVNLFSPKGNDLGFVGHGDWGQFTIPASEGNGTYTLQVHDDNFTDAGSYAVGLERLKAPSPDAVAIAKGSVIAGTISAKAEADQLTFSGTAGDVVQVTMAETSNAPFFPFVNLFTPSGDELGFVGHGDWGHFVLPATGTYVLLVHDDNVTDTGSYTVGLESLKPASQDTLVLFPEVPKSGTISPRGENDLYSFYADANDTVAVQLSESSIAPYFPFVNLFSPAGAELGFVGHGDRGNFKVPTSGVYTLFVHDDNVTDTGNYTLTVSWVAPNEGSIYGNNFNDANGNGTKDAGETGLQGWTLYLDTNNNKTLDPSERSAVTDALGNYAFTSVSAGNYVVREVLKSGWTETKPAGGSYSVAVAAGANISGKDFGNRTGATLPTVSIVATDATATEPSTAAAAATDTGVFTISRTGATTAALNFSYTISGSATNGTDYALSGTATIAAGAASTTIKLTPKFDTVTESAGETAILTLASSASYTIDSTKKAATVTIKDPTAPKTISGKVFHDSNGNGVLDTGELPLSQWKVFLDNNLNGVPDTGEPSKFTDNLGAYSFPSQSPPTRVRVVAQTGWLRTSPAAGYYAVAGGASASGDNFGFARPVSISGTIFTDTNANGIRDTGEALLSGWKVFIDANKNGVLDAGEVSVLSNASGVYSFTGLKPGTFAIKAIAATGRTFLYPSGGVRTKTLESGETLSGVNFAAKA